MAKKPIDAEQVKKLAGIGCTVEEIAVVVGCSRENLHRRFQSAMEEGWQQLRLSLRRMQFKSARAGKLAMQIWLGKQYLGQTDRQHIETSGSEVRIVERIIVADAASAGANG